jgi:DNA repair photolyase
MATWKDKIEVTRENGEVKLMAAPQIISCSRSTDIPAFYSDWFFHRLRIGYSAWTNPFNNVPSYISYANTRFIVFWSKNPYPLLKHLDELEDHGINCYIQYTLNDYEHDGLEKNVPSIQERIDTFLQLEEKLGYGGIVWRFDPLILTDKIGVDELLRKVEGIGDQLQGHTEKLVFSFLDLYKKIVPNLQKAGITIVPWQQEQMEQMAQGLSQLNKKWGLKLATCAEKFDLDKYEIEHNRCIDGDLIVRRAYKDAELMKYMGVKICPPNMFEVPDAIYLPDRSYFMGVHKKDNGQRELCGCMAAKDIGEYNTCIHQCEYCYANTSKATALANFERNKEKPFSESITGK